MAHGWEGNRIRLVPLEYDQHFENCLAWINDTETSEWLAQGDLPMTRLAEKEWFESVCVGRPGNIFFAIELLNGTHIGNSSIHDINYLHGTALTGSLIGASNLRGQGYGTEAAQLRAWYCFHVLGLRLIKSSYLDGNFRSKQMQERSGYVEYGRVPQEFWKRGAYRDHILTLLTRERWMELSGGNRQF
ncbi:GNAT family protein [Kamptonema cortianum]|nr:GNAT family protein [Geitlerinema splendidum]MDK3157044.1 GNAT family protein [Kamptonema cortianum]